MAYEDAFFDEDFDDETMEDLYLTFRVKDRDYGMDISKVLEIIVLQDITDVPDMPPFVKGVINLRGKVIPVVDMRNRFALETDAYHDRTVVIVVETVQMSVGLIVDAVNEVVKILRDQIEPAPRIGDSFASRFVESVGKVAERVIIILNLDKILNEKEIGQVHVLHSQAAMGQSVGMNGYEKR